MIMTVEELNRYTGKQYSPEEGTVWMMAAVQAMEAHLGRMLSHGEYTQEFIMDSTKMVLLRAYPVDADEAITVSLDGNTIDRYHLCAGNGILELAKAEPKGKLTVTYTGGYTDAAMPEPIKVACALIVGAMVSATQNAGQIIQTERLDGYSVTYAQNMANNDLAALAPAACALLRPYIAKGW